MVHISSTENIDDTPTTVTESETIFSNNKVQKRKYLLTNLLCIYKLKLTFNTRVGEIKLDSGIEIRSNTELLPRATATESPRHERPRQRVPATSVRDRESLPRAAEDSSSRIVESGRLSLLSLRTEAEDLA